MSRERKPRGTSPRTGEFDLDATRTFPGPYWHGDPSAVRMLNAYHFVYRQYGFSFNPNHQDLVFYEWLGATRRLSAFLKWKTANMLARAVNSLALVECPFDLSSIPPLFDVYFAPGHLGLLRTDQGFHRMKLRRRSRKRYAQLIYAVHQAKAASLAAEDWEIEKNVEDTISRLSTPKELNTPIMLPNRFLRPEDVVDEIDRTLDEVIKPRRGRVLPRRERPPSRGACLGGTRPEGGSLGWYVRHVVGYSWLPTDYLFGYFVGPRGAVEVRSRIPADVLDEAWLECVRLARAAEKVDCIPVGLPEPFKVRVITKGYAPSYSLARAWQPALWAALKDHPTFQLIGTPLEPAHIRELLHGVDPTQDNWLISGDYKQATDHIPSEMSNYILSGMCSRLGVPIEDQPALLRALTGHRIRSPRLSREAGRDVFVDQRSGQLMGSPVSFPVLCVYNAVLTRIAYESSTPTRRTLSLDEIPMLVNGDDLLLVADPYTYETWKHLVKWGGLLPSVGKTLVSRNFATINSQLFHVSRRFHEVGPYLDVVRLPHVQLQLAVGSMKSGHYDFEGGRTLAASSPLSETRMWHDFMDSCADKVRGWKFLWGANAGYLASLGRAFPTCAFCLPPALGGMGFPLPPTSSPYYSSRVPGTRSLLLARLLGESATERHARLRQRFCAALESECENPSESLLFQEQAQFLRSVGCPFVAVPRDQMADRLLPPSRRLYDVALSADRVPLYEAREERRVAFLSLVRELRAYARSGRGPWSLSVASEFSQSFQWSYIRGHYSSPFLLMREDEGVAKVSPIPPPEAS